MMLNMNNYELYTLIFSGIVAASAIASSIFTVSLIKETKRMRQSQAEPHILPYFHNGEVEVQLFYLTISNIGVGTAYNVRFEILQEFNIDKEPKIKLSKCGIIKNGIKYFPPRSEHEYFMGTMALNSKEIFESVVKLQIEYEDIFSNKKMEILELRMDELFGKSKINPPDSELGKIGYYLEKIQKTFEKQQQEEEL